MRPFDTFRSFRTILAFTLLFSPALSSGFFATPANAWSGLANKVSILSGPDRSGNCTTNCQYASSIKQGAFGNIYIVGGFDGTIDLDPGAGVATLSGSSAAFVAKYDAHGDLVWGFGLGNNTTTSSNPPVMNVDSHENVYVAGEFQNTRDFDPGTGVFNLVSAGSKDVFVLKLNSSGEFVWAKRVGGSGSESYSDIQIDSSDNVFVTGSFSSTVDFDPGSSTFNLTVISGGAGFLLKLDSNGDFSWAKSLTGVSGASARGVSIDSNGNIYLLTRITTGGAIKTYVLRMNPLGEIIWTYRIGNDTAEDQVGDFIKCSPNGEILVLGNFNGTVDFDAGDGSRVLGSSGEDGFLLRLNSDGGFIAAQRFDGSSPSEGGWGFGGFSISEDGALYVSGHFSTRFNFLPLDGSDDVTTSGNTSRNVFFAKLSSTGEMIWARQIAGSGLALNLGLSVTSAGTLFLTGYFTGTADFDMSNSQENIAAEGGGDAFALQVTTSGSSSLDRLAIPTLAPSIAVFGGFNTQITNASDSNTYTITTNKGSATLESFTAGIIPLAVQGLLSGETSTIIITSSRRNFLSNSETLTGTALRDQEQSLVVTSVSGTFGTPLSLATSGGSGSGAVSFVVNSGNCSLAQSVLNSSSAGDCVVTATKASDSVYNSLSSDTTTVTLAKATPTFAWSNVSKTIGDSSYNVTAPTVTGGLDGSFTYASSDTSVVAISGNTISLLAVGSSVVTATFIPTDTSNYNSGVITQTITVNSPPPPPAPVSMPSGGGGGGVGTTWFNLFVSNPEDPTIAFAGEACAIFILKGEDGDKASPTICASKSGALDYEASDGNYLVRTFDKASPKYFKEYKAKVTFGTFEVTGAGYRGGSVPRRVITVLKPSEYPVEAVVVPSPSPSPSVTPSASPSPSPSATPSASPSPSPSATPSTKIANANFSTLVQKQMALVGLNVVTNAIKSTKVTMGNQKKVEMSLSKPLTLTIPSAAKGLKARASVIIDGKAISLGSLGSGDGKSIQLPALKFTKTGIYKLVVKIGQSTKSLTISVGK